MTSAIQGEMSFAAPLHCSSLLNRKVSFCCGIEKWLSLKFLMSSSWFSSYHHIFIFPVAHSTVKKNPPETIKLKQLLLLFMVNGSSSAATAIPNISLDLNTSPALLFYLTLLQRVDSSDSICYKLAQWETVLGGSQTKAQRSSSLMGRGSWTDALWQKQPVSPHP